MPKIKLRYWRFINMILIIISAILPWINIVFDAQSILDVPTPGWRYIFATWQEVVNRLLVYGIELLMLPFLLISLSGVLIVLYLIFNLFSIIKDENHKNGKVISGILLGILVVLLFLALLGKPMLGYWLINLGILSSAILEWMKTNTDLQIRK